MSDQAENLRQMVQNLQQTSRRPIIKHPGPKSRVIAVTSGKGGVGKTNITTNLAIALANLGQRVLVIDADLGMANVNVILGRSAPYSFLDLLDSGCRLTDIVLEGPRGIKFISGGSGIYQLANLADAQIQKIINQIMLFDRWADIILVDTGAGLSRNVLKFVMAADEVIIVTTPEPTAITDAYAMMKVFAGHNGQAPLRLVVNRVLEKEEGFNVIAKLIKVANQFLQLPLNSLGFVYEDKNVTQAVKQQVPFLLSFPHSLSAKCVESIAHQLLYGEEIPQPQGVLGFFTKILKTLR
jgi:flagellar biosynthesis protein FlhG